jgi:ribosomal protein S18 acetylase RimI-like enzyme
MIYRKAKRTEADTIAHIHAKSWQTAYKGILTDAYLENDIWENRRQVWQKRFAEAAKNEFICVAVERDVVVGFVCVYGEADDNWGALIDNLHVLPEIKGRGIGKRLMQEAAKWVTKKYSHSKIHLWVYEANDAARGFYEKMGGENVAAELYESADGTVANTFCYAWKDFI